jgi:4-amino-4-deoxy-L-arabinose transferase-like glycosyltransferase
MKITSSFKSTDRNPYLILLLWAMPIVLAQVMFQQSLMAHDEGYYALQARYIIETGDWITPQWGGGSSFDRTIGIQWLIALCYKLFGVNETAVRLPSIAAYLISTLLTFRIGELVLGRRIGFIAALIFAVMPIGVQYAGLGTQDMMLLMIELLAAWSLLESQQDGKRSLLFLTGVMFGWGFMIKGFMMIPATIAFLPALWFGGINPFSQKRFQIHWPALLWILLGGAIGLMPVFGWLWAATLQYGWEPVNTLVGKILILNDKEFHSVGPLYYFWNIPANAFPWGLIGPIGLALACLNPFYQKAIKPHRWLLIGFPVLLFIELNLFRTKTPYYPIQLLPWLAIWSGILLHHCTDYYRKDWRSQLLGQISLGIGILGFLLLTAGVLLLSGIIQIESDIIKPIAAVGAVLGIGWLMPRVLWRNRSWLTQSQFIDRWIYSLLLGPWLALTLMGLTGLWGDYAVSLKAGLQSLKPTLNAQTVHFISPPTGLDSDAQKDYILLTLHTPKLGKHLTDIKQLPKQSYAWISPTIVSPDRTVGEVRGWRLIQHDH